MTRLILDAHLLLMLVAGSVDQSLLGRHRRLRAYDARDFALLERLLESFTQIIVPPHVLTEASNLLDAGKRQADLRLVESLILWTNRLQERGTPAVEAFRRPEAIRLGLTDAVLLTLAETGATLMTEDAELYYAAAAAGYSVINFNYVRDGAVAV